MCPIKRHDHEGVAHGQCTSVCWECLVQLQAAIFSKHLIIIIIYEGRQVFQPTSFLMNNFDRKDATNP